MINSTSLNEAHYANISARDMLDHLFETYGNITAVNLEINFEHMRQSWDPQQLVESLFKQIQDFADYFEAGGVPIGHPQQINAGYAMLNYSHSRNPPCAPAWTHRQIQAHREPPH
jgi:hypothetical protein